MYAPREQEMENCKEASIDHGSFTREESHEKGYGTTKNTAVRFSRGAIKTLKGWCDAHRDHPYPSEQQKAELKAQTGLSITQISNWLTNARRRGKVQPLPGPSSTASDIVTASDLATQSNLATVSSLAISPSRSIIEWHNMTPLDRWRSSPPDCEAAPLSAVASAVATVESDTLSFGADFTDSLREPLVRAPSVSSLPVSSSARTSSSAGSGSSAHSSNSYASLGSFRSEGSRRRRRKKAHPRPSKIQQSEADRRRYQCTFCTDAFKSKHDWTRHEMTQHLSLEKWTCLPKGSETIIVISNNTECALCGTLNPSEPHMDAHRIDDCIGKTVAARTFYRKDHFLQHLRTVHGIHQLTPALERWTSRITRVNSRCGFCEERFVDWSARNNHLAEHFRTGASMKDWSGCRGLDPAVAMLVNNAMPPYLIGTEYTAMIPFSAESLSAQPASTGQDPGLEVSCLKATALNPEVQPSSFEFLTARLGQYVNDARTRGTILSDELLQREARVIVYGDDDPWNQTAADNPQWLALFKSGHALDYIPSSLGVSSPANTYDFFTTTDSQGQYSILNDAANPNWTGQLRGMNGDMSCLNESVAGTIGITNMPWFWQTPECLAEFRQGRPFCTSADMTNVLENCDTDGMNSVPLDDSFAMDAQPDLNSLFGTTTTQNHLAAPPPNNSNLQTNTTCTTSEPVFGDPNLRVMDDMAFLYEPDTW